jgi:hypothetical protein
LKGPGTRSRFEDEVWGGSHRASEEEPGQQCPGAEEEDAVEYGAHILLIDWIIGGLLFEFRSSPEESYNVS